MRSLSPLYADLTYLPDPYERITTLSIDTDTGRTYAVSEHTSDGDVNIQTWTVNANEEDYMVRRPVKTNNIFHLRDYQGPIARYCYSGH